MKRAVLVLSIFFVILLSACSHNSHDTQTHTLYFFGDKSCSRLISKEFHFASDTPENTVEQIFSQLSLSENENYIPIIPRNLTLISVSISDNTCFLTLSEKYIQLDPIRTSAINACLVKSLAGFEEFEKISITCEETTKILRASDFITEDSEICQNVRTVNLYFADNSFSSFICEPRSISLDSNETIESLVVSELWAGPVNTNSKSVFPQGTTINSVYVSDGICIIDLSEHFVENAIHLRQNERIILYSIVNTITELTRCDSVKFLINGEDAYGYIYYDISKPLTNAAYSTDKQQLVS